MSKENQKVWLVTGTSKGLGLHLIKLLLSQGHKVIATSRNTDALEKEITSFKENLFPVKLDITSDTAVKKAIDESIEKLGRIDVVVNNAGMHSRGDLSTVDPSEVAAMVDINLRAPMVLSCAAIPFLQRAGSGAIVMVGSLAGRAPLQGAVTYSGTKAGLRAFAYGLSDELRDANINVGVVSPGPIDTGFIMDEIDQVEDIVFSQPMSSASAVAEAVLAIAAGQQIEISMPAFSGKLTTLSYLFPSLRRGLRSKLYEMGRKNKDKYRNRAAQLSD